MTGSLTGLELFHKQFDLPLAPVLHTDAPYYFRRDDASLSEVAFSERCAARLNAMIVTEGPDTIAALKSWCDWSNSCSVVHSTTPVLCAVRNQNAYSYSFERLGQYAQDLHELSDDGNRFRHYRNID